MGLYHSIGKRVTDIIVSTALLVALSPLMLVITFAVKLTLGRPVFYRQDRVGRGGRLFRIIKFRSMIVDADRKGPGITSAGDARVTRIGLVLRKLKLDELPQLWNVLKGEMSLVGPRPELPLYVAGYDHRQRAVLTVRPGITDQASIAFRWEEELLSHHPEPEKYYRETVLPRKLDLNLAYITKMSLAHDIGLVMKTAVALLRSRPKICSVEQR